MNYQPQLVSLPDFWTINSMGSIISHYKDPITNQSVWWNVIDGSKFSYTCLWENTRVKVVPVMQGNWRLVKIRICCHFLRDEILIIETYENITFQKNSMSLHSLPSPNINSWIPNLTISSCFCLICCLINLGVHFGWSPEMVVKSKGNVPQKLRLENPTIEAKIVETSNGGHLTMV